MSFDTPNAGNLSLGAGEVRFARGFQSNPALRDYRHLGNVESLAITTTIETILKKSSMDGARGTYKEAVIGSEAEVSLVLDEFHPENLALAAFGDTALFNLTAAAALTAQPVNNGVAIKFERWYQLYRSTGVAARKVANVVIKQGANTLLLGSDYAIDLENGLVKIIEAGALSAESVTTWDGDVVAITNAKQVRGLSVGTIEGSLLYISSANQAAGPRFRLEIHRVQLQPDGELALISEEFGAFTLRGKSQKDVAQPAGEQFYVLTEL